MSAAVLDEVTRYIRGAVQISQIKSVVIALHGGEPTLANAERIREFCKKLRVELSGQVALRIAIQTNAVRIRPEWISLIRDESMSIGVSIDGEQETNDKYRVDHKGRGSYERIKNGIEQLKAELPDWRERLGAIAVLDEKFSGLPAYHAMVDDLGFSRIKFLFPDASRDDQTIETSNISDRLIEIFDHWLVHDQTKVRVDLFTNALRRILCAPVRRERHEQEFTIGLAILSDGTVQIADEYMTLKNWFPNQRQLNIFQSHFYDWLSQTQIAEVYEASMSIPHECQQCEFATSCAGGEVPSRYSVSGGFNHASVYCNAHFALYSHIAKRVSQGREALSRMAS